MSRFRVRPRWRALAWFAVLASHALRADPVDWTVLIVAGQSNALNWHARAADLPSAANDRRILFYYESGAPPEAARGLSPNSSSNGRWTTLRVQEQVPYAKYERIFFGPEITLARRAAALTSQPLALIKIAYFGTTLAENWRPDASDGEQLYARFRWQSDRALRQLTDRGDRYRLGGFFWMQGETDGAKAAFAQAYAAHLTAFIARVRTDFRAPQLPFVLGRVGPRPPSGYAFQDVVRAAQVSVAGQVPGVAWVDTDDLGRYTDGVHLLAPGVMTLGVRMAEAWETLRR